MTKTTLKQKLSLIAGGIIIGLLLLEVGLRLAGFIVLSLRDQANRDALKKKGEVRIICIGESTTYCGNHSYAYPRQLERILNKNCSGNSFTVVNKGKPGCSTPYILSHIERWIDKYQPEIIVSMMGINDTSVSQGVYRHPGALKRFLRNLRTYKLVRLIYEKARYNLKGNGVSGIELSPLHFDPRLVDGKSLQEIEEKRRKLSSAINNDPKKAQSYTALGDHFVKQDQYKKAAVLFRKALQLNPKDDAAHLGMGRCYLNSQHHTAAKNECNRAIEINPDNDQAWTVKAFSYMYKKKYRNADPSFRKALEINPDNDQALAGLAWIHFWKWKVNDKAKELARRALRINPKCGLAYGTLWHCFAEEGDYQAAVEACKKSLEAGQSVMRVYSELSHLYTKLNRPDLANKYQRKAHSLRMTTYNPITRDSYRRLRKIADRRRLQLVAVQYPTRGITPLKKMNQSNQGVIFVDNEATFKEALERMEYGDIFKDNFAGDFGHCTAEGNRILAENVSRAILDRYCSDNLSSAAAGES